jgi:hypothetical protein
MAQFVIPQEVTDALWDLMSRVKTRMQGQGRTSEILYYALSEKCMHIDMAKDENEYREARSALKLHLIGTSVLNNDFPNEERLETYLRARDFYFC